ncbi:hypothetical protein [Rhizobium sp. CF142]|uniref:hypothetical protein n=1 Tax=Rhizobium sp. CF142 TaxID=1144314 RepID=UPI0012F6C0B1|nr:hypothetical protein [Rhizobium sp. CF142]
MACVAISKGIHQNFPMLESFLSPIMSSTELLTERFFHYSSLLFDRGTEANLVAIEAFYFASMFMMLIFALISNLLIATMIFLVVIISISTISISLTGRKELIIFVPLGILISAILASTPWIAADLFRSAVRSLKDLLQNPIVIACAIALGVWSTVSAARSHKYDPDPVTEGAKKAWKFATGSTEDEVVNLLKKACSESIKLPPSFPHWVKLWLILGVLSAIDYFVLPGKGDLAFLKHVSILSIVLLLELLIVLEVVSFIVHTRRNRIEKQKETEN